MRGQRGHMDLTTYQWSRIDLLPLEFIICCWLGLKTSEYSLPFRGEGGGPGAADHGPSGENPERHSGRDRHSAPWGGGNRHSGRWVGRGGDGQAQRPGVGEGALGLDSDGNEETVEEAEGAATLLRGHLEQNHPLRLGFSRA